MSGRPDLVQHLKHELFHRAALRPGDVVLLGVSGGPDSRALLDAAARVQGTFPARFVVVHVHHGLRARDADRDARFVEKLAAHAGFEFCCERADVKRLARRSKRSIEDAARHARLDIFARMARRLSAKAVVLAHTADDQVETFFLSLLRGAGTRGLAGMERDREVAGLRILRPFLAFSRRDILAHLARHRLRFRNDRTNLSLGPRRNRIRHRILPFLERYFSVGIRRTILHAQENLARDQEALELMSHQVLGRALAWNRRGVTALGRAKLAAAPAAVRFRVLEHALESAGLRGALTRVAAGRLEEALNHRTPSWCPVRDSIGFWVRKGTVFLGKWTDLARLGLLSKRFSRKRLYREDPARPREVAVSGPL